MKKSKQVPATLVTAVAAMVVTGCSCGPNIVEVRRCVDAYGHVLPDYMCGGGYNGGYYGGVYYSSPHWGYGGNLNGGMVSGFHTTPSPNATVNDSMGNTISRGGFGSSGSSGGFGAGS